MEGSIIRIKKAEIYNIKNVEYGKISFPDNNSQFQKVIHSDIVGIYGQNGSGKTAFIDAMWIIKQLISGEELSKDINYYISKNKDSAYIKLHFSLNYKKNEYELFYEVKITRVEDNRVKVEQESLSYKELINDKWQKKAAIIDFDSKYKEPIFKPKKNYELLYSKDTDAFIELSVAKKLCQKNSTSFIFSNEIEEIITERKSFIKFSDLIMSLKHYINVNFFVIKNDYSGMINMNLLLPLSFRVVDENKVTQGNFPISLVKSTIVSKSVYKITIKVIEQINIVLKTIVPELSIGIENYGVRLNKSGDEGILIELVSKRDNVVVPLKYESDGIKKIISVLSILIVMYNNPTVCMVVDELDAGIFEYLLGEILEIIGENGKGQLVFTSHNMRPLEKLDFNSVIFTTTNPKNRYINFKNVKSNNNLRNMYYRSIDLGGQKEEVYKETNKYDISRAFRVAGRRNYDEIN